MKSTSVGEQLFNIGMLTLGPKKLPSPPNLAYLVDSMLALPKKVHGVKGSSPSFIVDLVDPSSFYILLDGDVDIPKCVQIRQMH